MEPVAPVRAADEDDNTSRFLMQGYKVIPCSKRYRHDWSVCPFAHTGEMAARRDPKLYLPIFCYHSKQRLPCPRGEQCPHAHNLFEYWLHPARYRTELCQFGMGCTRPVCFFAHNESQLRNTGMPGGPQPVVAPPEPIMGHMPGGGGGPPGLGAGGHRAMGQDRLLLSSISEAAIRMNDGGGGGGGRSGALPRGADDHAVSDVLPVLGGNSARAGRGAGAAFGAHAPAGALNSMPLPRLDWSGAGPSGGGDAALQAALAAQQVVYGGGGGGCGDLTGLDAAGAALALAQAQLAAQQAAGAGGERRPGGVRRSVSEAAALAPPRAPGVDMAALMAATTGAMAAPPLPAAAAPPPGAGPASAAAVIEQLQRQLAALQYASGGAGPGAASAPLPALGTHAAAGAGLLSHQSDVATLAAALAAQQGGAAERAPGRPSPTLEAQLALARAGAGASAPASPGAGGSPLSAPLPLGLAALGGRADSPSLATLTGGGGGGMEALLMIGDEGMSLDRLQEQLADAPRRSPPGRDARASAAGASAPLPKAPAGGMGREAAAQLLSQMPESAVRDLLRVLAAGQAVLSQQAA
ncbi:MAG: hypothetical protein J3K34DRAFT_520301 [Monoraphidium minutum]|nr:MAG: hypothetical protein J3K34DRAFT_520301 [Monoraphidium minutum]